MRIFTHKDKRATLVALRTFMRPLTGERIPGKEGSEMVDFALLSGLTLDEIFNPANFSRALNASPGLTAADYIELMVNRSFEVRSLKDDEGWNETACGFLIVAETAQAFYKEITANGGKWNTPTALNNLAKCIRHHSLQAILSEGLINIVSERMQDKAEAVAENPDAEPNDGEQNSQKGFLNFYNYILTIDEDVNTIPVDDSLTEEQQVRLRESEDLINAIYEEPLHADDNDDPEGMTDTVDENDDPYDGHTEMAPEEENNDDGLEQGFEINREAEEEGGFTAAFISQNNPRDTKRNCIWASLGNYTYAELGGFLDTMENGAELSMQEIIENLTDGKFDVYKESPETARIHMSIVGDLLPSFIECVRTQGIIMDENLAAKYDILHDSWDLRDPAIRKLHKLKLLIYKQGDDDPDLIGAIHDIENLYTSK